MNIPKRMAIFQTVDKIRLHWLGLIVLVDALYGGLYMFGPANSAPQVLLGAIFPSPIWGGILVVSAVLITFGWSIRGGVTGTFGWGALAIAAGATIVNGTALSYGGPILLGGMAAFHALITYDVGSGLDDLRERQQRR